MNRTMLRGVTAGLMSGVVACTAAVAGTAMADSGPADGAATAASTQPAPVPVPLTKRMWPDLPAHTTAAKARHAKRVASRAHMRSPLSGSPQTIAHALLLRRGWSESQWTCLDRLWTRESGWQVTAQNSSGAYGIPQSLPASKMSMMGSDWRTNPITQIRWGLSYIADTYGSPCAALAHSDSYNYY